MTPQPTLTPRQQECVDLICDGKTDIEIGIILGNKPENNKVPRGKRAGEVRSNKPPAFGVEDATMGDAAVRQWLILRTRPNFELKVETAVQQIGIEAYCPEIVTKRRHPFDRRQTITVRKAIYGGYTFCREFFPVEQITTTTLSAHWLKNGQGLAHISNKLMDLIEAGERIGCAIEEAIEALRCAPITKRMMKRDRFSRDLKATLGRAA